MTLNLFTLFCHHHHYPFLQLFLSFQTETADPVDSTSSFLPPPAPGMHRSPFCLYERDCSGDLMWVGSHSVCLLGLAYLTLPNFLKVHPYCSMCQNFHPFWGWIISPCMRLPHLVNPFICPWTRELVPPFGYCEYGCYEHTCTNIWDPTLTFWGYIPKSGIAGSYNNSIFNFLRNSLTVFPQWLRHFIL